MKCHTSDTVMGWPWLNSRCPLSCSLTRLLYKIISQEKIDLTRGKLNIMPVKNRVGWLKTKMKLKSSSFILTLPLRLNTTSLLIFSTTSSLYAQKGNVRIWVNPQQLLSASPSSSCCSPVSEWGVSLPWDTILHELLKHGFFLQAAVLQELVEDGTFLGSNPFRNRLSRVGPPRSVIPARSPLLNVLSQATLSFRASPLAAA